MSDISLFPKSFKMIEFVNKSVKDETKRINCKKVISIIVLFSLQWISGMHTASGSIERGVQEEVLVEVSVCT